MKNNTIHNYKVGDLVYLSDYGLRSFNSQSGNNLGIVTEVTNRPWPFMVRWIKTNVAFIYQLKDLTKAPPVFVELYEDDHESR